MDQEYDEIGVWSEVKLAIVKDYAAAYATIMDAARRKSIPSLKWIYIDAYAGPGIHLSRETGETVKGSPLIAVNTNPPFHEYHFIDSNPKRVEQLRLLTRDMENVFTYEDSCDNVLMQKVFPRAEYRDFRRALCLLDPYSIDLNWRLIEKAGKMGSVEVFVNFMIMDVNRNVLRNDPLAGKVEQMTRLWGDETWRDHAYYKTPTLFEEDKLSKVSNERLAEAFRRRLVDKAGFKYVPKPMPMKTKSNSIIYYLYFASPNNAGAHIVEDIFSKYSRDQGF